MPADRSRTAIRARLAAAGVVVRGLSLDEAAAYVGLSRHTFEKEVAAGRFPPALSLGTCDRHIWDRRALDAALDRLAGLPSAGHDEPEANYGAIMRCIQGAGDG
ncbi:MAG: helix-turn-helix transcriptional regulator [Hyphomicrobiaceae bacterium]